MLPGDQPNRYFEYSPKGWNMVEARVITETTVSLTVNGQVWLSFMCTPIQLDALALGFLYNEGLIQTMDEVAGVRPCKDNTNVDVWLHKSIEKPQQWRRTSGCTGGVTSSDSAASDQANRIPVNELGGLTPELILSSMDQLFRVQELYRQTRGIHCSALSDGEELLLRAEDIGRHNTLDKISGMLLQSPIGAKLRMILTTGRISSEMLQKSARIGASIVVSRTAASSMAIELAEQMGVTLIGYARRNSFNVYAHPERLAVGFDQLAHPNGARPSN